MKNLLTKMLFISLLSSAVIPSGVQANFFTMDDIATAIGATTGASVIIIIGRNAMLVSPVLAGILAGVGSSGVGKAGVIESIGAGVGASLGAGVGVLAALTNIDIAIGHENVTHPGIVGLAGVGAVAGKRAGKKLSEWKNSRRDEKTGHAN